MNNLKCKLLKALMGVSIGALGAFAVTFVVYFWNLDMKLTSVMEGILLKHYDRTRSTATSTCDSNSFQRPSAMADGHFLRPFSRVNNL